MIHAKDEAFNELVKAGKDPKVCPVCNGTGEVPANFYSKWKYQIKAGRPVIECRTCNGKGIVWNG